MSVRSQLDQTDSHCLKRGNLDSYRNGKSRRPWSFFVIGGWGAFALMWRGPAGCAAGGHHGVSAVLRANRGAAAGAARGPDPRVLPSASAVAAAAAALGIAQQPAGAGAPDQGVLDAHRAPDRGQPGRVPPDPGPCPVPHDV